MQFSSPYSALIIDVPNFAQHAPAIQYAPLFTSARRAAAASQYDTLGRDDQRS